MKNASLKRKIILVVMLPMISFLTLFGYQIYNSMETLSETKQVQAKVAFIAKASSLVHETQKERGATAGFLSGGVSLDALKRQRSIVNDQIKIVSAGITQSMFSTEYQKQLVKTLKIYKKIRVQVEGKSVTAGQAIGTYTGIIKTFLQLNLDVANNTELALISAELRAFKILEDAKESGGKLRANISSILSKDLPINDNMLRKIITLKSDIISNISSSGLLLDENSQTIVAEFKTSPEWLKVSSVFMKILKKSAEGLYGENPSKFFQTITTSLNILGELVLVEKAHILKDVAAEQEKVAKQLWSFVTLLIVMTIFLVTVIFILVKSVNLSLSKIVELLGVTSTQISSVAGVIAKSSVDLAEATNEQASGLQETVSSIDEISAMVAKNSDAAQSSKSVSLKSQNASTTGKDRVSEMLLAIQDISDSNGEVMEQMRESNREFTQIVQVISQIGEKTKVINDIVFQTKLLSFNASVEAARAGEHGKGFAVVAEEVGNLATMSGKAATEISSMLDESIKKVEKIVDDTKVKVERLVEKGKDKLDDGKDKGEKCDAALDEILENVSSVNEMVGEIAYASNEQSQGVQEITKAMAQLDQVTQQNSSIAQQASSHATQLSGHVGELEQAVLRLSGVIHGGGSAMAVTNRVKTVVNSPNSTQQVPLVSSEASVQQDKVIAAVPSQDDARFEEI